MDTPSKPQIASPLPDPASQDATGAKRLQKRKKSESSGPPPCDFPVKSRQCPRCGSWDTQARSTQGNVQYRICRRAVCRHSYAVVGRMVDHEK